MRTEADETGIPRPAALRLRVAFFAASLAISLVVYRAALDGPFVSDDLLYLVNNVTVRELDRMGLPALFDPRGAATLEVGNYAPLLLLVHAAEWRVFGTDVRAYHVVNLVLHALCATLLLSLLQRNAVASGAAFFAAGFFLLHPANVEAVAWISQLKSVLALALALGALLALERHPLAATALFAAALLTKAIAAFALLSQQRAALWRDEFLLLADSAAHYPQGGTAHFVRAVVVTHRGHPEAAIASLRASADRGYHFMRSFDAEPMLAPLHSREDFRSLIRDIARRQIAYAEERRFHTPPQLRGLAAAYLHLGEFDRAIEICEQAIRQGGPLQAVLIDELHAARDEWARARTSGGAP